MSKTLKQKLVAYDQVLPAFLRHIVTLAKTNVYPVIQSKNE